jgi:peroxiredoxin
MVFDLNPFRRVSPPTARGREAIVTATLAALIVVNGLLAWENIGLKSELALAGEGGAARSLARGGQLRLLEIVAPRSGRRTLFSDTGANPILLLIFDTSCPHCENTLPQWSRLAALCADRGVEVLGASLDDTLRIAAYAVRHDVRFAVATVPDAGYFAAHGIDGVPVTILADGDGTVLDLWPGGITEGDLPGIERAIDRILSDHPAGHTR